MSDKISTTMVLRPIEPADHPPGLFNDEDGPYIITAIHGKAHQLCWVHDDSELQDGDIVFHNAYLKSQAVEFDEADEGCVAVELQLGFK